MGWAGHSLVLAGHVLGWVLPLHAMGWAAREVSCAWAGHGLGGT